MWIKVEYVTNQKESIIIPFSLHNKLQSTCFVNFGNKSVRVKTIICGDFNPSTYFTFDNPMTVKLSDDLRGKLLIPENHVCRMKIKEDDVIIGPVIGFMLGGRKYAYSSRSMRKFSDRFGIYNKVGGLIFAFSPDSVDWEKEIVYGIYYNNAQSKWVHGVFPLPSVIYRRNFCHTVEATNKFSLLSDSKLFNSYRFTKLELFDYVKRDKVLAKNLPTTEALQSYDQLKAFIDTHTKVILKPIHLSRGRGICIIEKTGSLYKVFDYRTKVPNEITLEGDNSLFEYFENNNGFFKKYLVQKHLRLAKIDNRRYDIRVVMQKKDKRSWICNGIECRVSSPDSLLTNISRGGYALPLDEALTLAFDADTDTKQEIADQINDYCFRFCKHMDKMGEHFAEFGVDIALDEDKNIWLIEANVLPSFKGFKKMDYNMYLSIRHTPLLYALSLTEL